MPSSDMTCRRLPFASRKRRATKARSKMSLSSLKLRPLRSSSGILAHHSFERLGPELVGAGNDLWKPFNPRDRFREASEARVSEKRGASRSGHQLCEELPGVKAPLDVAAGAAPVASPKGDAAA